MRIKMIFIVAMATIVLQACKKESKAGTLNTDSITTVNTTIINPTDPAIAVTQGFFLDNWQAKAISISSYVDAPKPTGTAAASVTVDLSQVVTKISPYMFGNNINPYMGQVVTEPVLMNNLTNLAPRIIRAPGGSLSDVYFWDTDSKVPADVPATLLDPQGNTPTNPQTYWFGKSSASFTLNLINYYQLLQTTNSTGIITVNYGYARYGTSEHPEQVAAHLAANWVRYDKGRTRYWEIGNENYGNWEAGYRIDVSKNKDGQPAILTGALYGTHFKIFADSMRKAALEVGATIKIGAVMTINGDTGGGVAIANWNTDVVANAGNSPDFYIVHNYYTPYNQNSTAATILNSPATETKSMMTFVQTTAGTMQKPVALTEWNIQAIGGNQNVSNIAGLHAVMTLGETILDKLGEASRWDLANGWGNGDDQGLFNIGDEPNAAQWNPRPAFYYLYYFQKFLGDRMVPSTVSGSADIVSYASSFSSKQAATALVNKSNTDHVVSISFKNFAPGSRYYYYTLNGGTEATFSRKVYVNGTGSSGVSGGPDTYNAIKPNSSATAGGITVNVPAYGAVFLIADSK
jgi:hypothetical protein